MSQINIEGMEFLGCHGVNPHEKLHSQRFRVSIVVTCNLCPAAIHDDFRQTVNWSTIRKTVQSVIEAESCDLVETLAWRIINKVELLSWSSIARVEVKVEKPDAWKDRNGVPSIVMARERIHEQ